ncbi:MAG: prepilin peptidase [Pseudomonadota bacterium]
MIAIAALAFCAGVGRTWLETRRDRWIAAGIGLALAAWGGVAADEALRPFAVGLAGLLAALAWIDIRMLRLPNFLTAAVAALGAAMVAITAPGDWIHHAAGGAAGYGALVAVEVGYRALKGRDGLGRGDAKLLGALGVWTGWTGLPIILLAASASGLIFAIVAAAARGEALSGRARLAFGPFLALGGWAAWLYGGDLLGLQYS